MNFAYFHLVVNHVPIVGFGFAVVGRERWGSGVGWSVCGRSYQAGVVSITSML